MAVAGAVVSVDRSRRKWKRTIALTFSGNYAASGDVLSLAGLTNPNRLERALPAQMPPVGGYRVLNHPAGYVISLERLSAVLATGFVVRVYHSDDAVDALDEIATGAVPAALTSGDSYVYIEIDEPIL